MEIVDKIGIYVGVAAFFGTALLALLYFSVARDVRRLREWAGRAPERATGVAEKFTEEAAKKAKPRRARLRMPGNPKYIALIVGGVVVVGAAVSFAAIQISSDDTKKASKKHDKKKSNAPKVSSIQPSQVTVAVLNGTSTPGLASAVGSSLRAAGFKVGNVTNASQTDVVTTKVLYKKGNKNEAKAVSKQLKVKPQRIEVIDRANASLAGSADVTVVTGSDRAKEAPAAPPASQPPPATGQSSAGGVVQPQ